MGGLCTPFKGPAISRLIFVGDTSDIAADTVDESSRPFSATKLAAFLSHPPPRRRRTLLELEHGPRWYGNETTWCFNPAGLAALIRATSNALVNAILRSQAIEKRKKRKKKNSEEKQIHNET
jgi:hypothetical protein